MAQFRAAHCRRHPRRRRLGVEEAGGLERISGAQADLDARRPDQVPRPRPEPGIDAGRDCKPGHSAGQRPLANLARGSRPHGFGKSRGGQMVPPPCAGEFHRPHQRIGAQAGGPRTPSVPFKCADALGQLQCQARSPAELAAHPGRPADHRLCRRPRTRPPHRDEPLAALLENRRVRSASLSRSLR